MEEILSYAKLYAVASESDTEADFANSYQARMLGWKYRAQLEVVTYYTFNRYLLSN